MTLLVLGLSHKTTPVALREQLNFDAAELPSVLAQGLRVAGISEMAILSTCNRTELYCVGEAPDADSLCAFLADIRQLDLSELKPHLYCFTEQQGLQQMMRVASGLDSMVLGEPQILGQMKTAYALAHQSGAVGKQLENIFQRVFATAKRVRTETHIGANPVSVAYAAVSLARHMFTDLSQTKALLIGAGEMIELVARHLHEAGVSEMTVANRTLERAYQLSETIAGARAITLDELPLALESADMVISCTASTLPILGKGLTERVMKQRKRKPLFMVDLAVPRDIEPEVGKVKAVYLYSIDDLENVVEENRRIRLEEAEQAEQLIETCLAQYLLEEKETEAVLTVRAYREKMEMVRAQALAKALQELEAGVPAQEVLDKMSRLLLNKVMHHPTVKLKKLGSEEQDEVLDWARQLLGISDSE